MLERDLIQFIEDLQLQCDDNSISDHVLSILQQYARGEICRDVCINLIFLLLRPFPELSERFAIISESPPPPAPAIATIDRDPYIGTVIEFELWPGALSKFLWDCRQCMLGKCSIEDAFVNLEHVKQTSGPFWLLWELFEKTSRSCPFIQLIYDSCVGNECIPPHIKIDLSPLEEDRNAPTIVPDTIVDSDLVCCYHSDCRSSLHPLGKVRHGSYGLLANDAVDIHCAGRTVLDASVINDRWATNAVGGEGQFVPSEKTVYEERLFDYEDDRIVFDVRLCRFKATLKRLTNILNTINGTADESQRVEINPDDFPRANLTQLDFYTIQDFYGTGFKAVVNQIQKNPLGILPKIIETIQDRIHQLDQFRDQKEPEYYDICKKNYPKTLEVSPTEKPATVQATVQKVSSENNVTISIESIPAEVELDRQSIANTCDLLLTTAKLWGEKSVLDHVSNMLDFIQVVMKVKAAPDLNRQLFFTSYRSITTRTRPQPRFYNITRLLAELFQLFIMIAKVINNIWGAPVSTEHESSVRGLELGVHIGHVPESALHEQVSKEPIAETLPTFLSTGKANHQVLRLGELLTDPIPTLDILRTVVTQFINASVNDFVDPVSQHIMDAVKVHDDNQYLALTIEKLSGELYYSVETIHEEGNKVVLRFHENLPRFYTQTRKARIIAPNDLGPTILWDTQYEDIQSKVVFGKLTMCVKSIKRSTDVRPGVHHMRFRISPDGLDIEGGSEVILPKSEIEPAPEPVEEKHDEEEEAVPLAENELPPAVEDSYLVEKEHHENETN